MSQWLFVILRAILVMLAAGSLNGEPADIPNLPEPGQTSLVIAMEEAETAEECISLGTQLELDVIDISRFDLTVDEADQLYGDLVNTAAIPWYVDRYAWGYGFVDDRTVTSIQPRYLDPEIYDRAAYERAVEKALSETVYPGMSEMQIALSVHDYLASICAYDDSLSRYTGYDVLVRRSAVCQGYAEVYMDLLSRAGVECIIVSSEEMNHAWNQVKIGESWYHVDVTWDDPTPNVEGQVLHHVFLISDESMETEEYGYYGWESPHTCTDQRFETDQFWTNVTSRIIYTAADNCYLRTTGDRCYYILQRNDQTGEETRLYRFDFKYTTVGQTAKHRFHYYTAGLFLMDGGLYFTDVTQVRRLDLETLEVTPVYEHDVSGTKQVLVGSGTDGRTLYLTTMDEEQNQYSSEVPFPGGG